MIYFCDEIWISEKRGAIAGVGYPSSCELYLVLGNKRLRVGRIVQWEKENDQTYPRLKFRVTKSLNQLRCQRWVMSRKQDRLIPYKCKCSNYKINFNDNI